MKGEGAGPIELRQIRGFRIASTERMGFEKPRQALAHIRNGVGSGWIARKIFTAELTETAFSQSREDARVLRAQGLKKPLRVGESIDPYPALRVPGAGAREIRAKLLQGFSALGFSDGLAEPLLKARKRRPA